MPHENELHFDCVMSPAKAYFSPVKEVALEKSVGLISAETVSPYPPGVPRLIPGVRITHELVDFLVHGRDAGMFQEDAEDSKLKKILVVDTDALP